MRVAFYFINEPFLIFPHAKKIIMFLYFFYFSSALRTIAFLQIFFRPKPLAWRAIPAFITVAINFIFIKKGLQDVAYQNFVALFGGTNAVAIRNI